VYDLASDLQFTIARGHSRRGLHRQSCIGRGRLSAFSRAPTKLQKNVNVTSHVVSCGSNYQVSMRGAGASLIRPELEFLPGHGVMLGTRFGFNDIFRPMHPATARCSDHAQGMVECPSFAWDSRKRTRIWVYTLNTLKKRTSSLL